MKKTTKKEIKAIVDAYEGKSSAPLDPDVIAVCAAAMKPKPGATPEEVQRFRTLQRVAMGTQTPRRKKQAPGSAKSKR